MREKYDNLRNFLETPQSIIFEVDHFSEYNMDGIQNNSAFEEK